MDKGTFNLYSTNLETTPYGKVFQKLVAKDGFSNNIIENYNNEVLVNMKNVIEDTVIETNYGTIHFKNVFFDKPRVSGKNTELTPKMSREKLIKYFGDIYVDIEHRTKQEPIAYIDNIPIYANTKKEVDILEKFKIGSIPVMLGSKLCHLSDKTAEEKVQMGECFNDPLGYFIINSERVIINQENLRFSTFLIYALSKDTKCSVKGVITCPTKQGSKITNIVICKHSTLSLTLNHIKENMEPLNLFMVYRILGVKLNEAREQILGFIDEKYHEKVNFKLASTIAAYKIMTDEDEDVELLKSKLIDIRRKGSTSEQRIQMERVLKDLEDDLLSNIESNDQKLLHLSMYAARILEYMIDVRKLDDRDNFGNKRIATPGRSLFYLFKGIWTELIRDVQYKIDSSIKTAKHFSNIIKVNEIKDQMKRAFGPNAWGVKRAYKKENITESLKRDTPLAVYSQICRVNTPTSKQSKNAAVRMPHASGLGYCCLYDTPEGEGLGLVKSLATSCYISLERDPSKIINIIKNDTNLNGLVFKNKTAANHIPLLVNGILKGWCIPDDTVKILKNYKSQGYIDKDVCIFNNIKDNCVEIYCDGGRPCRPLFVVNENCELVIDKLNMWNANIDELIVNHCIEYIDAREQEWLYLAESVEKISMRKQLLDERQLNINNKTKLEDIELQIQDTLMYSHCEIDPSAMLSVSANLNPQAHRQAGPRTSFQCVEENTLVMTKGFKEIPIKDLKNGDVVLSVNPITYEIEETKIYDHFIVDSSEKGGDVLKITTLNGESIIVTEDHQFLTDYGWKRADNLQYGNIVYIYRGAVTMDTIVSITKMEHCRVADFTTESDNHSFISNNFVTHNCGMSRQALTQYHSNEYSRFDTSYKMVYYPTKPLFQTDMQETTGSNALANGQLLQVAIMVHPDNAEDGIVFKEEAIKYANKMDMCKKFTYMAALKIENKNIYIEKFGRPPIKPGEPEGRYSALDEKGIPILDAYIRPFDCVIGKIKEYNKAVSGHNVGDIENISEFAGVGEEGYIDRVLITTTEEGEIIMKVKVRQNRKYIPGDKLASRYSQKGTVSRVIPARDLPRVASGPLKGMVPDIMINPHSQPSRMTMNKIVEILVNKAACINGKFYNATTFRNFDKELEEVQTTLQNYGLDPMGNEYFEFPDGTPLKSKIFFGPCFYQALRHHVNDKIQMRSRKGVKPSTRQPMSGRSNEGGLKVGEMERDALISHGSSGLLMERLLHCSDIYNVVICSTCGTFAITKNIENDPNPNVCQLCGPKAKFGVITIPYVLKLLIFYLMTAGILVTFKTKEIELPNNRKEEEFLV